MSKPVRVKFEWQASGFCRHPKFVTLRTSSMGICKFPSLFGIIIHPTIGLILYDTGYSPTFLEKTQKPPEFFYRMLIPVHCKKEETALAQICERGFIAADVKYIVLSHFHSDHIAGLCDFPNARFIFFEKAFTPLSKLGKFRSLLHGFLPELLPHDFANRCTFAETLKQVDLAPALYPFKNGYDLLGDRSLIAIELPGHVNGQLGLLFRDERDKYIFLVADACWLSQSFQANILPHPLARIAIANWQQYQETLHKLHTLYRRNPQVFILPSHCEEAATLFKKRVYD